jgi:branched-chain amino acid transport system permease protein
VVGSIIFVVVVVGGMGSLAGAFVASILIGLLHTLPLTVDASLADAMKLLGAQVGPTTPGWPLLRITLAQAAPILPYLLLVLILIFRPKGLLGTREG